MSDDQKPEIEHPEDESFTLPEFTPAMNRRLKSCFDHGKRMTSQDRPDFDYANTMFTECVIKDPANLTYLESFFDNLCRKYNNNKKGARIKVYGSSKAAFKKSLTKKDWAEVLQIGPELLKVNPWDIPTLRAMGQACEVFRPALNDAELKYLRMALDANPRDVELNKHCARSLARMSQFDGAIACWRRVEEVKKNDPEAQRAIAKLMLDKTRPQVGIDDDDLTEDEKSKRRRERAEAAAEAADTAREEEARKKATKLASEEEAREKEERRRKAFQLTPRQQLEKAINDNVLDVDNYIALCKLHEKEGRPADVKATLQRAVSAVKGDMRAQEILVAYETRDIRRKAEAAQKKAKQEKSAEAVKRAQQLVAELMRQELVLYAERAERFSEQPALKYEAGVRLKKLGKYDQAIDHFEHAEKEPRLQARALIMKGECQQQTKLFQKALETFKKAVDEARAARDVEYRKRAMWRAARLSEGLKQIVSAEKYYQMLYEFDPDYEDVRTRLDRIRQIRDSGGLGG